MSTSNPDVSPAGTLHDLEAARARRSRANGTEPWVRKDHLAEHFSVSTRSIERWMFKGMPHRKFGVVLFQVGACEEWLEGQAS